MRPLLAISGWTAVAAVIGSPAAGQPPAPCASDDPVLSEAAAFLLDHPGPLSAEAVADAVRAAGATDVRVRALRLRPGAPAPDVSRWLREVAAHADAPLVCGEAFGAQDARVVLATPRGGVLALHPGPPRSVRVRLVEGFDEPELVMVAGDGTVTRRPPPSSGTIRLDDSAAPTRRIQLLARGASGVRPVADLFLPEVDARVPALDGLTFAPGTDPENVVDAIRLEAGVAGALRRNRLLRGVAEAQAERVCALGAATHLGEAGLDPEDRLRRAGLEARVVGEAVARGVDAAGALRALLGSPAHRALLLDRRFTDLGATLASSDHGGVCLVVLVAAWPRAVPRAVPRTP